MEISYGGKIKMLLYLAGLQGALDMVILLINDIVSFQEELEAQTYNEVI